MLEVLLGTVVLLELIAPFTPKSYGLDGGAHLNWIHQFSDLVVAGNWIPRWVPNAFGSFGGATFYFYPPFTYYVASGIRIISGLAQPATLYQLTGLLGTLASFGTCFLLLRSLRATKYHAGVAGLLYAFGPLRMLDLYNRCSLSSHMAYIFFPLAWMGLLGIVFSVKQPSETLLKKSRPILILGISLAFLGMTSVPLTAVMIVAIFLSVLIAWRELSLRILAMLILAGVLSIGLAAFHYAAALEAAPYIWLGSIPLVPQVYGFSLGELFSPEVYNLLLLFGSVLILCIGLWFECNTLQAWRIANIVTLLGWILLAMTIITVVLDTSASKSIWEHIMFLQLIQFASRFTPEIFIVIVMIIGLAMTAKLRRYATLLIWIWVLASLGPATLIALNLHLTPHSEAIIGDAPEYRPFDTPHRNQFIVWLRTHENDPAFYGRLLPGEYLHVHPVVGTKDTIDVNLLSSHSITLHEYAWPFWKVYSGNSALSIGADSVGRAVLSLPGGRYSLRSAVEVGAGEVFGRWISVSTVFGMVCFCSFAAWQGRSKLEK